MPKHFVAQRGELDKTRYVSLEKDGRLQLTKQPVSSCAPLLHLFG
jgi:hypothetical protein